jgi:hypothetical protein
MWMGGDDGGALWGAIAATNDIAALFCKLGAWRYTAPIAKCKYKHNPVAWRYTPPNHKVYTHASQSRAQPSGHTINETDIKFSSKNVHRNTYSNTPPQGPQNTIAPQATTSYGSAHILKRLSCTT